MFSHQMNTVAVHLRAAALNNTSLIWKPFYVGTIDYNSIFVTQARIIMVKLHTNIIYHPQLIP